MKDKGLQVILDRGILGDRDLIEAARGALDGGASFIQLRDKLSSDSAFLKEARILRAMTRNRECVFIINDRADIALLSGADGVHLGQADLPYKEARSLLGDDKIIGISTHDIEQALRAQSAGADYIGFGPVFATETKPALTPVGLEAVSRLYNELRIPVFFIGGINLENINEIIRRGGRCVAAAGAILNSDNISKRTRVFIDILENEKVKT